MKNILLASVAFVLVAATASFAAAPIGNAPSAPALNAVLQMLADNDSSGNSGGGGGDDSAGQDSGDDHGGSSGSDDSDDDGDDNDNDNNDDNNNDSGSGRSKPRVPGGSGCDSAQDRAEHPGCTAG